MKFSVQKVSLKSVGKTQFWSKSDDSDGHFALVLASHLHLTLTAKHQTQYDTCGTGAANKRVRHVIPTQNSACSIPRSEGKP